MGRTVVRCLLRARRYRTRSAVDDSDRNPRPRKGPTGFRTIPGRGRKSPAPHLCTGTRRVSL